MRTFLLQWQAGNYQKAAQQTDGETEKVSDALLQAHRELDLAALRFSLGPIEREGDTATAAFGVQADLGIGDPVWNYEGKMGLKRVGGEWAVEWSPSVIHPELDDGERMAITYDVPDRGQIYDRQGRPLAKEAKVVAFGVLPGELSDMSAGIDELAELTGEDPEPLLNRVRSAPPDLFQPLVLMREKDVSAQLKQRAERISGVRTVELKMPLGAKVAPAVVGEVAGTAEHNVSNRVSGPYQAGDTVGLGGLQSAFQSRLAGTATTKVVTLKSGTEGSEVLNTWPGQPSGSLNTTLDTEIQKAAEDALSTVPTRSHLVAVDTGTGEVLAAASQPGSYENSGAFAAEYRPGEAFSIVSAAAMLGSGAVSLDQSVSCPQELKVGDRSFTNPGGGLLWGEQTLERGFAYTCTTAFAGLAGSIQPSGLGTTAAEFGIGGDWVLPVPSYSGEFAEPGDKGEMAAAVVGSDQVTVSPLSMALVAGAVADGTWHAPRLVKDPVQDRSGGVELDEGTVKKLRTLMRATVVEGSATAANVGVEPVYGQTGVAEQKIDGEKRAVQWFVGYQGGVAFAAVVEAYPSVRYQYAVGAVSDFLYQLPAEKVQGAKGEQGAQGEGAGAGAGDPRAGTAPPAD